MKKCVRGFGMLVVLTVLFSSSCGPIAQVEYPDGPAGEGIAYMYLDRKTEPQSKAATSYTWVCEGVRYAFDVFITVSSVSNSRMFFRDFTIVAKQNNVGVGVMDLYSQAGNVLHTSAYPDVVYENGALTVPVNKWVNSLPAVLDISTGRWFGRPLCVNKARIQFR